MTTTTPRRPTDAMRRIGFVAAAIANLVVLWIVHRLPDWEWPPFLTDDFEEVLPHLTVSLLVSAAFDLVWAWSRPPWLVHLGRLATNVITAVVSARIWEVYPFDLATPWDVLVRTLLGVAFVGSTIGAVAELVKLVEGRTEPD